MAEPLERCAICTDEFPLASVQRCYLCTRPACGSCAVSKGGRVFCSKRCADAYFFSGIDDATGEIAEE